MTGSQRYDNARLVCRYLEGRNLRRAEVTAREIASFHRIPGNRVPSLSALLNFLQKNHIRNNRYGFFITGTQASRRSDYPHRYWIELMDT